MSYRAATAIVMMLLAPYSSSIVARAQGGPDAFGEVAFIYLVPSDRSASAAYPDKIRFAAKHFQAWLGQKLDGRTFQLTHSIVRTLHSDKPARWFSAPERHVGQNAFYRNTLEEVVRLGVAKQNDPRVRYIVYVDADHACGQSGAGSNGLAIVSANDLRGLSGEKIVPACEKANGAEIAGRCRWIGGMGHELLHTLGLMHPDRSPTCQTAQCRSEALMMHGYVTYPDARLLEEERFKLHQSPFLGSRRTETMSDCRIP